MLVSLEGRRNTALEDQVRRHRHLRRADVVKELRELSGAHIGGECSDALGRVDLVVGLDGFDHIRAARRLRLPLFRMIPFMPVSTLGTLMVTSPEFIESVCGQWPKGLQTPDTTRPGWGGGGTYLPKSPVFKGPSTQQAFRQFEAALPLAVEVKVHGIWTQRIAYVGYPANEDGTIQYNTPYPVFVLDDETADRMLNWADAWRPYADAALRRAAGLQAYCYVDDY